MPRILRHPILDTTPARTVTFTYEGIEVAGEEGFTIAAALHQAGFPVHSHSLKNRNRSLECGIGKCGACEMLVDGEVKRICITKVDGVREVREIPRDYAPPPRPAPPDRTVRVFTTEAAIIGAGPAGLAARAELRRHGVRALVIDSHERAGGQFLMQTHPFFFFEKERVYGGMRGFDIAAALAGDDLDGILLNSTVWDILEGGRLAVKDLARGEVYYVDAAHLIVATGAVPFMPPFKNDDLPGVYTAAVMQKMMNLERTLLGRTVLTVGAGNIGYLTSYQLLQAGAHVRAIVEAQPAEGGFPVQANRVRRLGIPILLSHVLLEAIPNDAQDGIVGVVLAQCRDFAPVAGTEKRLDGIDAINICTGLTPDDQLRIKGEQVFGRHCHTAGDAVRIGEGTSAVLRGRQAAFEVLACMHIAHDHDAYLRVSKDYIDSQQRPVPVRDAPAMPPPERRAEPFVLIDCLHGFACNPCAFACPHGAITKTSTSSVPRIDFARCVGCMQCVHQCPGLAIFGYDLARGRVFLPVEFEVAPDADVILVDAGGRPLGAGVITRIRRHANKTSVVEAAARDIAGDAFMDVRGFIARERYPAPLVFAPCTGTAASEAYLCHCDDVKLEEILEVIGDRRFISVDEVKHTTRLGMGACRGKRCIPRLKQTLAARGIALVGAATPRAPMSNQLVFHELHPSAHREEIIAHARLCPNPAIAVRTLIAGGGIAGSALFRYLAEAGHAPVLVNHGHGASWRNIAGGRPGFSLPELSDIAQRNHEMFKALQDIKNIEYRPTLYVTFAHDEAMRAALEASMAWCDAFMVAPRDFRRHISPHINPSLAGYSAALVARNCWQAAPGRVVDLLRTLGIARGGQVLEDCRLIDVHREGAHTHVLVRTHAGAHVAYRAQHFVNALGPEAEGFARRLGIETGLYRVRHQAFITRRLPMLGAGGAPLPMLIDRRMYRGFSAVYGQQLGETGQVIGCASPAVEPRETDKDLKVNSREFLEIASEVFSNWIPELASAGLQAVWAGYYVEPRMIVDPARGLFVGLRGQGFMLAQYLAKMYADALEGAQVPAYFTRLALEGDGLRESAFK